MSPLEPRGEIFTDEVTVPVGRWLWILDFSELVQVKDRLPSDTTRSEQLHANRSSVAGCFDTTPPLVRSILSFSGSPIQPGPFSGRSSLPEATDWPLLALQVLL
jgi:hypothetical protein